MGRWRALSPATTADLARIENPTLLECGYDAIEIEEGGTDDQVRRRNELGLLFHTMKSEDANS